MRTVVLLCEHNTEGSFGLVLNRKAEPKLGQLIGDLAGVNLTVFYGGPVQTDTLHFLHQMPDAIPGSQEIAKGIYWGGDFEIVASLLLTGELNEHNIRFYLGYSGCNWMMNSKKKVGLQYKPPNTWCLNRRNKASGKNHCSKWAGNMNS